MQVYRTEHPTPQWERENWRNLNGEWEFDFDFGKSARDRKLWEKGELSKKINVPFCPESKLSGIGYTDFIDAVCYRKTVELSKENCAGKVVLHFGAVDYESFVYVNGEQACHHIGGYSSFSADITKYVHEGENEIFVIAEDDVRSGRQPRGKQCNDFASRRCLYTRTTGIWQTVWLEFLPETYIVSAKYYPDIENSALTVTGKVCGEGKVSLSASFEGKEVGSTQVYAKHGVFTARLELCELHLWELGKGNLYDLELSFNDDKVKSYFGMREVCLDGKKFMLNGKCVFQRTVLDQGYYPDGIYTAKTDEELKNDIVISMNAGFNGARLHQKIFEPRYLYHCDKLGYMVWGEHGNWGIDERDPVAVENFVCEWVEAIERDFNHPAIIGWCPFNETWGYFEQLSPHRAIETAYRITKAMDPTRLCVDTSGNYHWENVDIYDVHNYNGDPETFRETYAHLGEGVLPNTISESHAAEAQQYKGEAVFVSEYGGKSWIIDGEKSGWGYGNMPKSEEEFISIYKGLTEALIDNPDVMGFCYTQLYDVEQEINGLYTYERVPKFDMNIFKKINEKKAAIEIASENE